MTTTPSPTERPTAAVVAARLRAAGCVFAEEEAALLLADAATPADLEQMVGRRAAGVPLEHVLGWVGFRGLRLLVEPGVFVPRARTELLVDEAAALARPGACVVDLCCGAGAVGAALASVVEGLELHAVEIDPRAAGCARRNLGGAARVYQGDLFDPLPGDLHGRVDVLVANAPYVPTAHVRLLPPEARQFEPLAALDGGADGLDVQRRIAAAASSWLVPGGSLLLETSRGQAATTAQVMAGAGLDPRVAVRDDVDATVVVGRRPAGAALRRVVEGEPAAQPSNSGEGR